MFCPNGCTSLNKEVENLFEGNLGEVSYDVMCEATRVTQGIMLAELKNLNPQRQNNLAQLQ